MRLGNPVTDPGPTTDPVPATDPVHATDPVPATDSGDVAATSVAAAEAAPPRVDVVIPAFNRQRMVVRAIGSVLEQVGFDVRVWVVDDASADATAAVVAQVADTDPRVQLLRHPANLGVSGARNTGIAAALAAGASYVVLLDSDDRYAPGALRPLWDALTAQPTAACAQGSRLDIPETVVLEGTDEEQRRAGVLVTDMFISGILVRSSTFARFGLFDPSLRTDEDAPWFAAIADAGVAIVRVPEVTLLRTKGTDNLSLAIEERQQARLAWVRTRLNAQRERP